MSLSKPGQAESGTFVTALAECTPGSREACSSWTTVIRGPPWRGTPFPRRQAGADVWAMSMQLLVNEGCDGDPRTWERPKERMSWG